MLTILTCLRSKAVSQDWNHHVWLLGRTLDSLLAQTNPEFRIGVACHDIPDIPQLRHSQVHVIPVSFAPPARNNDEMCADKVLKLTAGIEWALAVGTEYVMFADGDDLASQRLSAFVAAQSSCNGWFNRSEYFYRYGGRWLRVHDMEEGRSGPTIIVRANALLLTHPMDRGSCWHNMVSVNGNERYLAALAARTDKVSTLAAVGHTNYTRLLATEGWPVEPLPFAASVVILHPDSTSNVPGGEGSRHHGSVSPVSPWRRRLSEFKQVLRWLPAMRPLTRRLCSEFSIPTRLSLPANHSLQRLPF